MIQKFEDFVNEAKKELVTPLGFKKGDVVRFKKSTIEAAKKDYENPSPRSLELFGLDVLKSSYEFLNSKHIIDEIVKADGGVKMVAIATTRNISGQKLYLETAFEKK